MRSRKLWRVWVAWRTRTEDMVMGLVALSPTWGLCEYVEIMVRVVDVSYQLGLALLALLMLGVDARVELAFALLLHCWVDLLP